MRMSSNHSSPDCRTSTHEAGHSQHTLWLQRNDDKPSTVTVHPLSNHHTVRPQQQQGSQPLANINSWPPACPCSPTPPQPCCSTAAPVSRQTPLPMSTNMPPLIPLQGAGAGVKLMQMGGATPKAASRPLPRPHRPSPAIRAQPTARL